METEFDKDEFSFAYPDGVEHNYWNSARNRIILDTVKKIPSGKIIDVGAGRGIVTGYLHQHGCDIQGVELGSTTPISNSGAPVRYRTDVMSLSPSEASQFTIASFFDVLEHIEDPVSFIQKISLHFQNVEYLIITVPARKELWTNFDDYYGHFRRYDPVMLQAELEKAGFEMICCRYFFHLLYLMIRMNNMISKKRAISFNAPKGFSRLLHATMATIFYIEKFVVPGSIPGSSLICIARRKR